jgi:hypothetical protein
MSSNQSPSKGSPFAVIHMAGPPPPLDAEFRPVDATKIFGECGLRFGRCFGSKSGYLRTRRKSAKRVFPVSFNANVFSLKGGKLWWGDLDIYADRLALERVAAKLRCRLYVLYEFDGRFAEAELTTDEIIERAIWHTGGPARVPGVASFLQRSGLTVSQVSVIASLERGRLTRSQPPNIALEVRKRLAKYDEVFCPVAQKLGYKKWGQWWTSANKELGDRSPIAVLKSGGAVNLSRLLGDRLGDEWLFACWGLTIVLHNQL